MWYLDGCDDELGDTITASDRHGLLAEIDENDFHLPAIVGIDRPGAFRTVSPCLRARPERGRT